MDFRFVLLKGDPLENVKEEKKLFIILDKRSLSSWAMVEKSY